MDAFNSTHDSSKLSHCSDLGVLKMYMKNVIIDFCQSSVSLTCKNSCEKARNGIRVCTCKDMENTSGGVFSRKTPMSILNKMIQKYNATV